MSDNVSKNPAAGDSAEACDTQEPSHSQEPCVSAEPCDRPATFYGKAIDRLDECQQVIKGEIGTLSKAREELTNHIVRLSSLVDPHTTARVGKISAKMATHRARLDADLVNIKARHAEMDSRIALLKADVLPAAPVDPSLGSPGVD